MMRFAISLAAFCCMLPQLAAQSIDPATIEVVSPGTAYYRVYVNDTEVSKHTTPHKAWESAVRQLAANPDADVRYTLNAQWVVTADLVTAPPEPDPDPNGDGNAHYESLIDSPNLVKAFSLRSLDQWSETRNGSETTIEIDEALGAAKFIIPPLKNEGGGFMHRWGTEYPWDNGDKLVVQHDFILGEHLFGSDVGGKFTNLCRSRDQITYELRPQFTQFNPAPVDLRCYVPKLEGRQERSELASDVADPSRTYKGAGGGYDRNPGPDSSWPYGMIYDHPRTFRLSPGQWCRVTYELHNVSEGTRVKVWLANEETEPALIIASPVDPSLGFLTNLNDQIQSWYAELDSSQERRYDEPQPERWAAFRNLVVLSNVDGESVLGGKPKR